MNEMEMSEAIKIMQEHGQDLWSAENQRADSLQSEILKLKEQNRNIWQNSVGHDVYLQVCAELDAAVHDITDYAFWRACICDFCKRAEDCDYAATNFIPDKCKQFVYRNSPQKEK